MSISFRPLTPSQEWSNDRWVGPSGSSSSIPACTCPKRSMRPSEKRPFTSSEPLFWKDANSHAASSLRSRRD
jgi:hypothetical protein